ncbi:MAG: phosphoglycolate phosphatase [Salinisphaeraceae bacterium]
MHAALAGIELVVFDLDGTLVDSAPDLAAATDAVLAELGAPAAGVTKVRDWVGNGTRKLVERALVDARLDPARTEAVHDRFQALYAAAPCVESRLFDGVQVCMAALAERGMPMALVTNKPAAFLPAILGGLGIEGYFRWTLGGDSLPQKKPDPAPLLHCAEQAGVPPEHCLMVGDSRHDVQAGRAAGFPVVAVTYGYNHGDPIRDSNPDYALDSLAELVA